MSENVSAGIATSFRPDGMNAALDSLRLARLGEDLPLDAGFTAMERKVLDRLPRRENCWIDVLETTNDEDCLYRACGQNGAICRYTNDLWQAEIYVQYY